MQVAGEEAGEKAAGLVEEAAHVLAVGFRPGCLLTPLSRHRHDDGEDGSVQQGQEY